MKLYEISQGVVGHEIFKALGQGEEFDLAIRRDSNSEKCLPLEVAYSERDKLWTVSINRSNTGNTGSPVLTSRSTDSVVTFLRGVAVGIAWGRSDYYRIAHHSV